MRIGNSKAFSPAFGCRGLDNCPAENYCKVAGENLIKSIKEEIQKLPEEQRREIDPYKTAIRTIVNFFHPKPKSHLDLPTEAEAKAVWIFIRKNREAVVKSAIDRQLEDMKTLATLG